MAHHANCYHPIIPSLAHLATTDIGATMRAVVALVMVARVIVAVVTMVVAAGSGVCGKEVGCGVVLRTDVEIGRASSVRNQVTY